MEGSTVVEPTHGLARNALGLPQVLFCIVTGAAPIAAMLFNDFWAVYGGGWAAPSAFIMATVALHRLLRRLRRDGPSRDRRRRLLQLRLARASARASGMGVALLIAACYTIFSAGVTGVTAYFANTTFNDWFGVDIPVWVWEFGTLGIMITARLLPHRADCQDPRRLPHGRGGRAARRSAFATLFQPKHGLVLESLLPWNFFDSSGNGSKAAFGAGTVGCRILRCLLVMDRLRDGAELRRGVAGSEEDHGARDVHLGDRARRPLHVRLTWMLVVAYGKAGIIPRHQRRSSRVTSHRSSIRRRTAPSAIDIGGESILTRAFELTIVTGSFACQLAFFNTATRYFFSMGREGVLPQAARAHASDAPQPVRREHARRRVLRR